MIYTYWSFGGGGHSNYNGYGCKTHTKAGTFGENTVSKNEGSLGEKPNFGSKLRGIGWECYFWSFSDRFKSRNLQKSLKNGKNDLSYRGFFWVRAIEEPTFHQKMWGLWVTAEAISKNMRSLVDSSAENKGSLEPYIGVTSIMGVPPPPRAGALVYTFLARMHKRVRPSLKLDLVWVEFNLTCLTKKDIFLWSKLSYFGFLFLNFTIEYLKFANHFCKKMWLDVHFWQK